LIRVNRPPPSTVALIDETTTVTVTPVSATPPLNAVNEFAVPPCTLPVIVAVAPEDVPGVFPPVFEGDVGLPPLPPHPAASAEATIMNLKRNVRMESPGPSYRKVDARPGHQLHTPARHLQ
jgi:hypothetical protein